MLVLLSLMLGAFAGWTGRSATFLATATGIVACWIAASIGSGPDFLELASAVVLFNAGLGLSLVLTALKLTRPRAAR